MDRLDLPNIQAALTTQVFGRDLVILPRTGSTNDVAKDLAAQGAPEGTVVVADEQTTGRGRMERRWLAPDATSILAETGREVERAALLAALLAGVEARYARLGAGESPHAEWSARLATLGQPVEAITPDGTLAGVAEAVDKDGALLLRTSDGKLYRFLAGDVTLARP